MFPKSLKDAPARVAALLASIATLLAALAPAVADLDMTSTAGVLGGAAVILGIVREWLKGQRAHEAREGTGVPLVEPTLPVDEDNSIHEATDGDPDGVTEPKLDPEV